MDAAWSHFRDLNVDNSDIREESDENPIINEYINEPFT